MYNRMLESLANILGLDSSSVIIRWIIPIAVVLIILFIISILINSTKKTDVNNHYHENTRDTDVKSSAMKTLDDRFARGEIDEDEYLRKKGSLK